MIAPSGAIASKRVIRRRGIGERWREAPWPTCRVIEAIESGVNQNSRGCTQKSCAAETGPRPTRIASNTVRVTNTELMVHLLFAGGLVLRRCEERKLRRRMLLIVVAQAVIDTRGSAIDEQ